MGTRGARKNAGLGGSGEAFTQAHWGCCGGSRGDHHSPSSRAPILRCRCPHPHSAFQLRSTLGGGAPEWGSCLCLAPLPRTLHFDPGWELYDSPPGSASCEGGTWVLGPRGLPWTSPQDPAALTETISHRARAGTWLGSHSSSRGSGCSPAAKCPCPSPSPQAGVSVRVCSC